MRCKKFRDINWTHLDCVEKPLSKFFEVYARYVSRHPWPFILFPILISGGLSIGFLHRNEKNDAIYLYTPLGSPSKYERETIHEKWPVVSGTYFPGKSVTALRECQSIVTSRDGGNILRPHVAQAINRLNLFIIERIKITYNGSTYGYRDLCLFTSEMTCYSNPQVGLISALYNNPLPDTIQTPQGGATITVNLTFPKAMFGTQPVYLASSLGEVTVNSTKHIQSAKAWLLIYQLQYRPDNINYISGLWEREYQKQLMNYTDPFIKITLMHSQTLSEELRRNAEHLAPRFALCFIILITFATLCTGSIVHQGGFPYIDWVLSKPFLATCGVVGAGLGVASAVGLLNFCGADYNQIVMVMPFLVISVRLDNTFLMISAVRHTSRTLSVEERMAEGMSEAAVSITITVLTDILSFATGLAANIPAVIIFCLYTTVAITLSFLYQLTFLMGLLAISCRLEEEGRHSLFFVKTIPSTEAKSRNLFERLFLLGSRPNPTLDDNHAAGVDKDWMSHMFQHWFGPVLVHPVMKAVVMIWFVLYLGLAGWACSKVQQGLEPVNLLVSSSYAVPHYRALEHYFWRYGSEAQICVNNAPNMTDPAEKKKVLDMVHNFATSPHSVGTEGVQFWLIDFEEFLHKWKLPALSNLEPSQFYASVYHFMAMNSFERYRRDVKWDIDGDLNEFYNNYTGPMPNLTSFRFSIGLKNFASAVQQIETVDQMRAIAAKYPEYNVTTFNVVWMFVDQYEQIWPNVFQEIMSSTGFMILIALVLIPHPMCSLWVAVVIVSVDTGVIGFMTLWGIRLDTVSMITLIMSVGFAVDFAAHTAHAFVASGETTPSKRIPEALGSIGWPALQGGLSTVLGVVVLADLDSYMVVAFFKTILLVITLAVAHGLIFLPVLLSIFVPQRCQEKKNRKQMHDTKGPPPAVMYQNGHAQNIAGPIRRPSENGIHFDNPELSKIPNGFHSNGASYHIPYSPKHGHYPAYSNEGYSEDSLPRLPSNFAHSTPSHNSANNDFMFSPYRTNCENSNGYCH